MSSVRPTTWENVRFSSGLIKSLCAVLICGVLLVGAPATPDAQQRGLRLSATQLAHVSRIKSYLNRITTLQARFIQTNPDGKIWQGTVSIQRPGNFRFDYDPPVPHTLISNGTWFIHVDRELQESNFLPLDRTPARFLLRKRVTFDRDVKLVGFRRAAGLIHLRLLNKEHPDMGFLTLTFNERPLALRQWKVNDAQNKRTLVTLQNTRLGVRLRPELFEFVEPEQEDQDQ